MLRVPLTPSSRALLLTILFMGGVEVLAVCFAMLNIRVAPTTPFPAYTDPSPHGYTWSLALYVVPLVGLAFSKRVCPLQPEERKAFWRSSFAIFPLWALLDIVLANSFFRFPNERATVESLAVWGYTWGEGFERNLPIEEFVFYILSAIVILRLYMWSKHHWYAAYNLSEEQLKRRAKAAAPVVRPSPPVLFLAAALIVVAALYKKLGPHSFHEGWPWYFIFLVVFIFVPPSLVFSRLCEFVNTRAFLFTVMTAVLVSLLWEATLALPYGWWNYQDRQMIGLRIKPWSNLPIEATTLWFGATWGVVFMYELNLVFQFSKRSLWQFLFGPSSQDEART